MAKHISSSNNCILQLAKAMDDYLLWMISADYASGTIRNYEIVLNHFQKFITHRKIEWSDIFTHNTLTAFQIHKGLSHASMAVRGLSRYLYDRKIIPAPIIKPFERLPDIYEAYLNLTLVLCRQPVDTTALICAGF